METLEQYKNRIYEFMKKEMSEEVQCWISGAPIQIQFDETMGYCI